MHKKLWGITDILIKYTQKKKVISTIIKISLLSHVHQSINILEMECYAILCFPLILVTDRAMQPGV